MNHVTIGHSDGRPVTIDPQRLVSTRMLVQANSGGGKSWMLRVLCERLGRSIPLIVLDWEGEFASLRERLDVLLVGREGEIPTAIATAGALATQVLEIGVSAVIDLYDLNPQDKRAYVRRFLESLMAAPKRLWSPRLVIVDEAHALVPEAGQAESADAVNALMSQGRKRQFCGILATQRLSKLHKDAAAEANNVLIGRCTLDVDQKRAGEVLGMAKADYLRLRDLTEGQFHAYGPAFNHTGVRLIMSEEVQTTHGAKAGTGAKPPEPSARMRGVVEQLRDLAERAKTEVLDLDSARATIRELRKQLAAKPAAEPIDPQPYIDEGYNNGIVAGRKAERDAIVASIEARVLDEPKHETPATIVRRIVPQMNGHAPRPVMRAAAPKALASPPPEGLTSRHADVLSAIRLCHAMGYATPTREQVSFWARKRGGNFNNLLGALRTAGEIDYPSDGTVRALGDGEVPDAAEAYQKALGAIESRHRAILNVVIERGLISREDLSAATGKSGGNFNNLIGALRTAGLVTYPIKGTVDAAAWLREFATS